MVIFEIHDNPCRIWKRLIFLTFCCHANSLCSRYIQAAAYPKDVIVLVDVSGSMTGLRVEIAKATVDKILDTLSDDDFFNVIKVEHIK